MDAPTLTALVYTGALLGGFIAIATWESIAPARAPRLAIARRWPPNLALLAFNQVVLPLVVPVSSAAAAWTAQAHGWGLLNRVDVAPPVALVVTMVAIDAVRYLLHRAMHWLDPLWRLHRVHHSDLDYDCTLSLRFHPFEALTSALTLGAVAIALGAPPWAVVASDAVTLAMGLFSHGNIRIGRGVERALRRLIVTPAMHATHHSVVRDETDSNFGAVFSWWDRLGGTWRESARAGDAIEFGLAGERDPARLGLVALLVMPFRPLRRT